LNGLTPFESVCKAWTNTQSIQIRSGPAHSGTTHLATDRCSWPGACWSRSAGSAAARTIPCTRATSTLLGCHFIDRAWRLRG
jgi:hypothetical protein